MDFSSFISKPLERFLLSKGKKMLKTNPTTPLGESVIDKADFKDGNMFTVGFSKRVIIPDDIETKKYYIAGYGENNPARGVIDPQYTHALWIDDNSGRGGVLFISLDIVGLLNKDVNRIREKLKDFCNSRDSKGNRKICFSRLFCS